MRILNSNDIYAALESLSQLPMEQQWQRFESMARKQVWLARYLLHTDLAVILGEDGEGWTVSEEELKASDLWQAGLTLLIAFSHYWQAPLPTITPQEIYRKELVFLARLEQVRAEAAELDQQAVEELWFGTRQAELLQFALAIFCHQRGFAVEDYFMEESAPRELFKLRIVLECLDEVLADEAGPNN